MLGVEAETGPVDGVMSFPVATGVDEVFISGEDSVKNPL